MCEPSDNPLTVFVPFVAIQAPESIEYWNVEPDSDETEENVTDVNLVNCSGLDVIVVSGAFVSITHVYDAGVKSVFPTLSFERTWYV